MKRSKRYVSNLEKLDKNKAYSVEEAVKLVKETSNAKFDSTIEVAMNLNLDTKKNDQQLRGAVVLPNGTGKTKRILVLAKGDQAKAAKEAGADFVGDLDMIQKIEKESWFDYDVIIATPEMMPMLGKIGKLLGPKGLMPNPKTGTVTTDTAKAIEETKKGKVNYRTDSFGNVHGIVGKASFDDALSLSITDATPSYPSSDSTTGIPPPPTVTVTKPASVSFSTTSNSTILTGFGEGTTLRHPLPASSLKM